MFLTRVKRKPCQISICLLMYLIFLISLILFLVSYVPGTSLYFKSSHRKEAKFTEDLIPQPDSRSILYPSVEGENNGGYYAQLCPPCQPCGCKANCKVDSGDATESGPTDAPTAMFSPINCSITPMSKLIPCVRSENEVFMPVSFINDFFEVYGEMKTSSGTSQYEFRYSYGTLYPPQPSYHPTGPYLNFYQYNVAARSKVLCVTATEGLPLTNQWKADGYYYAITVAQYGLSHHAKALLDENKDTKSLEMNVLKERFQTSDDFTTKIHRTRIDGNTRDVLYFSSPPSLEEKGPVFSHKGKNSSVCLHVFLNDTGGITVKIRKKDGSLGYVHFDYKDRFWDVKPPSQVIYGMGLEKGRKWVRLAREIAVDWNKAFSRTSIRDPQAFDRIVDVTLHGTGYLDNLTIAAACHMDHLFQAADWLASNQDVKGGWPTDFEIRTGPIHLLPGWYSAMAQGQALSTLVRAYNLTGRTQYLDSAVRALDLFTRKSTDGGVKAVFMGHLDWYEEYPTTPQGSFVLNGFIFSLLGLYDAKETLKGEGHVLAKKLWDSGMKSLKAMLGLFDSGTGTFYDLRHVVHHDQPNRARWDYHIVHITLIRQLAIVDGDPIFYNMSDRWLGYLKGERSKHN